MTRTDCWHNSVRGKKYFQLSFIVNILLSLLSLLLTNREDISNIYNEFGSEAFVRSLTNTTARITIDY
jgi:hypothetical protein